MKFIAMMFLFTACTHATLLPQGPRGDLLFPSGTYHHAVDVELHGEAGKHHPKFSFMGVVQLKSDSIKLVALSVVGTTLFRIDENRTTDKIEIQNYIPSLEPYKPQFASYYAIIREVLIAPLKIDNVKTLNVTERDANGLPVRMNLDTGKETAEVKITRYDASRLPRDLEIENKNYSIHIEVNSYAAQN